MANVDPLLPGDPVPQDPPSDPAIVHPRKRLVCEFCECPLAPSGEYTKLSERAKELRALAEKVESLERDLALSREQTATAERERNEARAALPKKSALFGG